MRRSKLSSLDCFFCLACRPGYTNSSPAPNRLDSKGRCCSDLWQRTRRPDAARSLAGHRVAESPEGHEGQLPEHELLGGHGTSAPATRVSPTMRSTCSMSLPTRSSSCLAITNHSAGADACQGELVKLVDRDMELRRDKGKDVRFVLFTPIAYQKYRRSEPS